MYSLADPGGCCQHKPPLQQDPFLLFLHTFLLKSVRVGGRHPPQQEILDLPLVFVINPFGKTLNDLRKIIAVKIHYFVMIQFDYYRMTGYCFYGTSLIKHIPEYDVIHCNVTYHSYCGMCTLLYDHIELMEQI